MELLPENINRYEIIDGILYVDRCYYHDFRHSDVNSNIFTCISQNITELNIGLYLGNMILYKDLESAIKNGDYVIPDIMIVCDKKENSYNFKYYGIPKFVAEVISPSTAKKDRTLKMNYYAKKGIQEYWIIDYKVKSLDIYYLQDGNYINEDTLILLGDYGCDSYNGETNISLKVMQGISLKLADIFKI